MKNLEPVRFDSIDEASNYIVVRTPYSPGDENMDIVYQATGPDVLEIIKNEKVYTPEIEKQITDLLDSFSSYWEKGDGVNE